MSLKSQHCAQGCSNVVTVKTHLIKFIYTWNQHNLLCKNELLHLLSALLQLKHVNSKSGVSQDFCPYGVPSHPQVGS